MTASWATVAMIRKRVAVAIGSVYLGFAGRSRYREKRGGKRGEQNRERWVSGVTGQVEGTVEPRAGEAVRGAQIVSVLRCCAIVFITRYCDNCTV